MNYSVLLFERDVKEIDCLSQCMSEVISCRTDTVSKREDLIHRMELFHYDLVILSESPLGFILLEKIKRMNPLTKVLLLSDQATIESAVKAIRLGAEDYVSKQIDLKLFQLSFKRILDKKEFEHYHRLEQFAFIDDVTGLYNTRYLNYVLDREIALSDQFKNSFAVLFIDADKFKEVNDLHGHKVGTQLLNQLGAYLQRFVRESDSIFRYGGDEFIAILAPCDLSTAESVAGRITKSVKENLFLKKEGFSIHLSVSIGIALFPDHVKIKNEIIEVADRAMYRSKMRNEKKGLSCRLNESLTDVSVRDIR